MPRPRSVPIRESAGELEQLRQFYGGKPQARRLLFLSLLKEDADRTISEASRRVGISDRRGRYWWDSYRKSGLQGLLDRRIWKVSELEEAGKDQSPIVLQRGSEEPAPEGELSGSRLLTFVNAVGAASRIGTTDEWIKSFRSSLLQLLDEVDYAVISLRPGVNVAEPSRNANYQVYRQHVHADGSVSRKTVASREYRFAFEKLIEEGKTNNFPFRKYHAPPTGFDFFLEEGQRERTQEDYSNYIGSLLLLRHKESPPISDATVDLVERLRPFIVFAFTDFVVRSQLSRPSDELFQYALDRVAGDVGLTNREEQVLHLEMLGHSYQEIADILHVSASTVQSHVRSIYRKAKVRKLSEFFAKYFTPERMFATESRDSE